MLLAIVVENMSEIGKLGAFQSNPIKIFKNYGNVC